jgi:hypothetical protein
MQIRSPGSNMFDVSVILCPRCMCPPTRCGRGDGRRPNSCRTSRLRTATPQAENNSHFSAIILLQAHQKKTDAIDPPSSFMDPGEDVFCWYCHQCCGSGIRCLFDPDPGYQTHIFERLVTFLGIKYCTIILCKLAQIFLYQLKNKIFSVLLIL